MIGGFTTQNSDAEWSDARQAYCADVLFDYYEVTGELDYLERAVAALRSTFAVAPYENWSHCGHENAPGAMTGIHWGTGSAMTSVELAYEKYRDVFINAEKGHGVGVNGCTLSDLHIESGKIEFTLATPFEWDTAPVLVVKGAQGKQVIIMNGDTVGEFEREELEKGVALGKI